MLWIVAAACQPARVNNITSVPLIAILFLVQILSNLTKSNYKRNALILLGSQVHGLASEYKHSYTINYVILHHIQLTSSRNDGLSGIKKRNKAEERLGIVHSIAKTLQL